jgi:hypothetical protein
MAKHYSKRASKKRRGIRKLRKTIRRKIQRGGGPEEALMIKLILQLTPQVIPIILSLINLGNVELLMSIIKLLSGSAGSGYNMEYIVGIGGSNKRQIQRGGGLRDQVFQKLEGLETKFAGNEPVLGCIKLIRGRISSVVPIEATQATDSTSELQSLEQELEHQTPLSTDSFSIDEAPVAQQTVATPQIEKDAKLKMHEKIINFFNERIKNKISANIDTKIKNIRSEVGDDVIACLQTLKTAIVNDLAEQLRQSKNEIKDKVIEKLNSAGGEIFSRLMFIAVQLSIGNRAAVIQLAKDDLVKVGNKAFEGFNAASTRVSDRLSGIKLHSLSLSRPKTA